MTDKTELDVSVEEVTHAVAEITKMDQVIAGLTDKYSKVIFDVETPAGLSDAKAARKEIREPRYLIENMRKAGKRPILELGKQLDGRAKEMTERLLAIEGPIDSAIKEEESRAERERQALIDAEVKRVEKIQEHIADIRHWIEVCTAKPMTAEQIAVQIKDLEELEISERMFQEFQQQAQDAKDATLARLRDLHRGAADREAEDARIAAEREELEQLRAAARRRDEIRNRIDNDIRRAAHAVSSATPSSSIGIVIADIENIEIGASFEEFTEEALEAKRATLARLRELHTASVQREQEEARRRAELEERERKVAEENERLAADKRKEARRQEIVNQINIVQSLPAQSYGLTASHLSRLLARAEGFIIPGLTKDDADLKKQADSAKAEAVSAIRATLEGRKKYESEQAELAREKAEREQREKDEAKRKAKAEAAAKKAKFPGEQLIVDCLVKHFGVTEKVARSWLAQCQGAKAA